MARINVTVPDAMKEWLDDHPEYSPSGLLQSAVGDKMEEESTGRVGDVITIGVDDPERFRIDTSYTRVADSTVAPDLIPDGSKFAVHLSGVTTADVDGVWMRAVKTEEMEYSEEIFAETDGRGQFGKWIAVGEVDTPSKIAIEARSDPSIMVERGTVSYGVAGHDLPVIDWNDFETTDT